MKTKYIIITLSAIFLILSGIYFIGFFENDKSDSEPKSENTSGVVEEIDPLIEYGFAEDEVALIKEKNNNETINLIISEQYDKKQVLELIKDKYYVEDNLERYFSYYETGSKTEVRDIVKDVNSYIDFNFYEETVPNDISKGILMIANKHYYLDSDYDGLDLVDVPALYSYYNSTFKLNSEAADALMEMWSDAKAVGLDFGVYSAYRSYDTQTKLYNNYVAQDGKTLADTYSARPGSSEHQTGLAIDIKSRTSSSAYFQYSDEFKWLENNAHKYGYILRYNLGQEYITGYQYEPWHYRYCGVECATYIYENNINFEEYYEVYVK